MVVLLVAVGGFVFGCPTRGATLSARITWKRALDDRVSARRIDVDTDGTVARTAIRRPATLQ